ncbi:MAG TPA: hypothetical protein VID03_04340, partial [Acidimicrobiia bacterium]
MPLPGEEIGAVSPKVSLPGEEIGATSPKVPGEEIGAVSPHGRSSLRCRLHPHRSNHGHTSYPCSVLPVLSPEEMARLDRESP